jgi:hypothetical protein
MYCKPGKARAMVEKFVAVAKASSTKGLGSMRVLTDISAERYWTVVSEVEVASIDEFTKMSQTFMQIPEMQEAMKGYHDLVDSGRREIYTIEK